VATTDAEYESANYWRGPTWIVTNAMAIWGLERYALVADADNLRQSTLTMMSASVTPWEYYDSTSGKGIGAPDFMWSGVFYMLLKDRELPLNEW
jgi:glycogen debranching enzyme